MTLPNFLVIGAAKAGTTSLYHYLNQHPDVYLSPIKETNFFVFEGCQLRLNGPRDMAAIGRYSITQRSDYEHLFTDVTTQTAIGEISPQYMYSEKAAVRIAQELPRTKLICVLRNPIERAYSHFLMFRREHREPEPDFSKALEYEEERASAGWEWAWRYKHVGLYAQQLQRYQYAFDLRLIQVFLYEDLQKHPNEVMNRIFDFLNVTRSVKINTSEKYNMSGHPRSASLHRFLTESGTLRKVVRWALPEVITSPARRFLLRANLRKPPLAPEVCRDLVEYFRPDIERLQQLIDRDLSHWLKY